MTVEEAIEKLEEFRNPTCPLDGLPVTANGEYDESYHEWDECLNGHHWCRRYDAGSYVSDPERVAETLDENGALKQ